MKWRQEGYNVTWECWHVIDETGKIVADVFDEQAASVIANAPERNRQAGALYTALRDLIEACENVAELEEGPSWRTKALDAAREAAKPFEVKYP